MSIHLPLPWTCSTRYFSVRDREWRYADLERPWRWGYEAGPVTYPIHAVTVGMRPHVWTAPAGWGLGERESWPLAR